MTNPLPPLPTCITSISALVTNRYYFATISGKNVPDSNAFYLFFSIDDSIAYPYIQSYFGPPSLGDVYRYAGMVNALMSSTHPFRKLVHCSSSDDPERRTNAAFLVASYAMLYMYIPPRLAYRCLRRNGQPNYKYFCDTSSDQVNGRLKIIDMLLALYKSVFTINMCSLNDFDVNEYECLHSCNDDVNMTWIVPNKLLAFRGPVASNASCTSLVAGKNNSSSSMPTATRSSNGADFWSKVPDEPNGNISPLYTSYFRANNVRAVVRCNGVHYDAQHFTEAGIEHHDLAFPDGTCPSEAQMRRFLFIAESTAGAVAVHCKAGLGRTGVLIAAYLIKHYDYTANEAVGWLRLCRPGSVIGVQHKFLVKCQPWLRYQGVEWRKRTGVDLRQLHSTKVASGLRTHFGIYSVNGKLECQRQPTDFVKVNKHELNKDLAELHFY